MPVFHQIVWVLVTFVLLSGCTHPFLGELPSHHAADGFQNPHLKPGKRGFVNYLKMRYFGDDEYADYPSNAHKVPVAKPDLNRINSPGDKPQVTWIGHATVLIQHKGVSILTDPMFSDRASPVNFSGPKRVNPPALTIEQLPPVDFVIISHNHYDHLDTKSVRKIGGAPLWFVPLGLKDWFLRQGIPGNRIKEFDWWETTSIGNVTITATPAQHWSARTLWDRKKTLWASWMVEIDEFICWYSGDTGYNPFQFKEIGTRFSRVDLGLISIGAYEPRWFMKDVHIDPEEAVQIHEDIHAKHSLAIQWGTFPMTAEPIDEPPARLKQALKNNNVDQQEFSVIKIGETWVVDKFDIE